jgi:hypothetical protein
LKLSLILPQRVEELSLQVEALILEKVDLVEEEEILLINTPMFE